MSEKREVLIRITGTGADGDTLRQTVVSGQLEHRDARLFLRYTECLDDSGADPDSETQVRLLADAERVMMRRDGAYAMSMLFDPAAPYEGRYHTPFGDLPFTVRTEQCSLSSEARQGRLELRYTLSIQGGEPEPRHLRIDWEEKAPC